MVFEEKSSPCERLKGIRTIHTYIHIYIYTYNIYPILHYPPLILSRSLRSLANKHPRFSIVTLLSVSLADYLFRRCLRYTSSMSFCRCLHYTSSMSLFLYFCILFLVTSYFVLFSNSNVSNSYLSHIMLYCGSQAQPTS